MTILETIVELLKLHGVDGRSFDRIDVALDALYKAEMSDKESKAKPEKKPSKKSTPTVEEHVGI